MRVLFVSNGFPPGGQWGTEFYTHQAAHGLATRGRDVHVFCPQREGVETRFKVVTSERYGVTLHEVFNPPARAKRFRDSYRCGGVERVFGELLERLQPDVVHFTHFLWGLSAELPVIAQASGARVVVTPTDFGLACHRGQFLDHVLEPCEGASPPKCARCVRGLGPYDGGVLSRLSRGLAAQALALVGGAGLVPTPADLEDRRLAIARAIEATDQFLLPTRALGERLLGELIPPGRTRHLPYGIEEEPFLTAPPRESGAPIRFGFLGQFQPHKGLDTIFRAVERLERDPRTSREAWSVRVHGNPVGGRHSRYLQGTWDPRLATRFEFKGAFEPLQAPWAMAELDAVLVPSRWTENAPLTILQALVLGLPILASDVPGIREVAGGARACQLVPAGDPASLAQAMARVIEERPARVPHPEALPISWREHLDALEDVYRSGSRPAGSALRLLQDGL